MKQKTTFLFLLVLMLGIFLRFFLLAEVPPGLYQDEVSIGYNAYTILTTGKDEFDRPFPLWFEAFGEYKLPLYIYSTSFSMALFGKNEFAVRFPSAMVGSLTLIFFYLFIKQSIMLDKHLHKNIRKYLPLVATFLLAIAPWHLQFSRAGFEANMALFFYIVALYCSLVFLQKKSAKVFFCSLVFLVLSLYTYNAYRFITPLTAVILLILSYKQLQRKTFLAGVLGFLFLSTPFIMFSLSKEGIIRFEQASAFSEYPAETMLQKIITYPMVVIKNYVSFFSFQFLFTMGDGIGRHQLPGFGLLPIWQLPFLLLGMISFLKAKRTYLWKITLFLLLVAPMAGALAKPSPHTLRSLLLVIPLEIIIAYGVLFLLQQKRWVKGIVIVLILFATYETIVYFHHYYIHYPQTNVLDWGGMKKEMVEKAATHRKTYDIFVVDDRISFASLYFNFYDHPQNTQYVSKTWEKPAEWNGKKILYIKQADGKVPQNSIHIEDIRLPNRDKTLYLQMYAL